MPKKVLKGQVVKKSGDKTYKVMVVYTKRHPKYKKIIHIRKNFLVHSEKDINPGTMVLIEESRRMSKLKHFKIIHVFDNITSSTNA